MTVPEDQGQAAGGGIHRDLIEDVRVIAVQRLSPRVGPGGIVRALRDRVEGAGCGNDRPADREAALLLDDKMGRRIAGAIRGGFCGSTDDSVWEHRCGPHS